MRYRVLVLPLSPRRTPTVPRDPSRTPARRPSKLKPRMPGRIRSLLRYLLSVLIFFLSYFPSSIFIFVPNVFSLSVPLEQVEGDRVTASPPENPRGES